MGCGGSKAIPQLPPQGSPVDKGVCPPGSSCLVFTVPLCDRLGVLMWLTLTALSPGSLEHGLWSQIHSDTHPNHTISMSCLSWFIAPGKLRHCRAEFSGVRWCLLEATRGGVLHEGRAGSECCSLLSSLLPCGGEGGMGKQPGIWFVPDPVDRRDTEQSKARSGLEGRPQTRWGHSDWFLPLSPHQQRRTSSRRRFMRMAGHTRAETE